MTRSACDRPDGFRAVYSFRAYNRAYAHALASGVMRGAPAFEWRVIPDENEFWELQTRRRQTEAP